MKPKQREELLAALFPLTVEAGTYTPPKFIAELDGARIRFEVDNGRVKLSGGPPQERKRHTNPDLEARLILYRAAHGDDVIELIKERACIRYADGYSDSLYDAVMCNIPNNGMCFAEAEKSERDSEGKIILREKTDWEAELMKYR